MEHKIVIAEDKINEFCKLNNFILINKKLAQENNMLIYLPYATKDNFLGKIVYPEDMPILINEDVWKSLITANKKLNSHGIRIVIYDAYRPINVQHLLWEFYKNKYKNTNELLVANPKKYGTHNIQIPAVDIMPVYLDSNKLINLPCGFDDFNGKSQVDMNMFKKSYPELYLFIDTSSQYNLSVNPDEFWHFTRKDIMDKYGLQFDFKKEKTLIPKLDTEVFKLVTNCQ